MTAIESFLARPESSLKTPLEMTLYNFMKVTLTLMEDVAESLSQQKENDTSFRRRQFTRAWFAQVEGDIASFYFVIYSLHLHKLIKLSFEEESLVIDLRYEITGPGKIKAKPAMLTIRQKVMLISSVAEKLNIPSSEIDFSGIGWDSFQKAIEIRNRVTHPKAYQDLEISNEDMKIILKAREWINALVIRLLKSLLEIMERSTADVKISD